MRRISGIRDVGVFSIEMVITDPEHCHLEIQGITIVKDGHASTYGLDYLRENCPAPRAPARRNAATPSPYLALPDVLSPSQDVDVEPVGNYAIRIG